MLTSARNVETIMNIIGQLTQKAGKYEERLGRASCGM